MGNEKSGVSFDSAKRGINNNMKRKNRIWVIFFFLCVMSLLTLCSQVLSEQSKPVVLAENTDLRDVIPKNYLYEIREDEKKAVFYTVEDTGRKRKRYVIKEQEAVLKEKTQEGYLIGGLVDYHNQWLVTYASGKIEDGMAVRVGKKEELYKKGTLLFFHIHGKEASKREFLVNGIPEEEEKRLREEMKMDEDVWKCCFLEEEKEGELSQNLISWGWQCVLFFLIFLGMIEGFRVFGNELARRLKQKYGADFLKEDSVFLLENAVWITIGFFILYFLAQQIGQMDYSFLHDWLPEGRIFDFSHYRQLYQEWKEGILLYCRNFPTDSYTALLWKEHDSWRKTGIQFLFMMAVSVMIPVLYSLVRGKIKKLRKR